MGHGNTLNTEEKKQSSKLPSDGVTLPSPSVHANPGLALGWRESSQSPLPNQGEEKGGETTQARLHGQTHLKKPTPNFLHLPPGLSLLRCFFGGHAHNSIIHT